MRKFSKPKISVIEKARKMHLKREQFVETFKKSEISTITFMILFEHHSRDYAVIANELGNNLLLNEFDHKVTSIYFDDANLKNFLLTTEIKDYQAIANYVSENGEDFIIDDDTIDTSNKEIYKMFESAKLKHLVFHLRIPSERYAYSFNVVTLFFGNNDPRNKLNILCIQNDEVTLETKYLNDEFSIDYEETKLAINFLYYVLTFPDALIDGKPKDADRDPERALAPKKILKVTDKIVESETHEKGVRITHFRKGHFRFLGSDYYTKKKGQYVFVKSSLVHGAPAKTAI